jgi:hypothetical protein
VYKCRDAQAGVSVCVFVGHAAAVARESRLARRRDLERQKGGRTQARKPSLWDAPYE